VLIIRKFNCINTAPGIVTLCKWPFGAPDGHLHTFMLIIRRLNYIDAASDIVTLSKWPSGAQVATEL